MKIVALAGSPRKGGNSDLLVDALLQSAQSKGAETEKIYLNELRVRGCQACYACTQTGRCQQKDDMQRLYDKLLAADLWVLATPVYWWGPSAQFKLVFDRLFCFCHGPFQRQVKGKRAVLVATFEDAPRRATPYLAGMMKKSLDYLEMELAGKLFVQAHEKGEVAAKPAALARARTLGARLAAGRVSSATRKKAGK